MSICCLVNSIVVCEFFYDEWKPLLTVLDFIEVELFWDTLRLIWCPVKVVFKFVWINEDDDCLGGSGVKGKICVGNYW